MHMDIWTFIGGIGVIIGIVAGVIQVLDYLQKRRGRLTRTPKTETIALLAPPGIPHNLPPRGEFIGREAETAQVHEALNSRSHLITIEGIGGIGKTSLALEVAYRCLNASQEKKSSRTTVSFSGFVWVSARDREQTLSTLLDTVAQTLERPGIVRQSAAEKQFSIKKLLQEKPYLLIIDNFETIQDAGLYDFLLNLPEPSKALITTREQKLSQARTISLKGLTETECLALVHSEGRRLGLASVKQADGRVLTSLFQATGGCPLAIRWSLGQIKQKGQSLELVLAALHEARSSIFDTMFARSWALLSKDSRQVLLAMPIFATSASHRGIEAASDVHHYALDAALGQLVEMSIIDATDDLELSHRRYSIHPLTRAFATARLKDVPDAQRAARGRLAHYYELYTKERKRFWVHSRIDQLDHELSNILVILQWCLDQRLSDQTINIFENLVFFMVTRGYWNDTLAIAQRVVTLASECSRESSAASFRTWPISWILRHRGELDLAEEYAHEALAIFQRLGEEQGIAAAKRALGRVFQERGNLSKAEQLTREALASFQSTGDRFAVYLTTANLASVLLKEGNADLAWELCIEVISDARKSGDMERIADLLTVLGNVAYYRGEINQARTLWQEALAHLKQIGHLNLIADNLLNLARLEIGDGRARIARQLLLDALECYKRLSIERKIRETEELLVSIS